jgi:Zn-dependent alcohol dehydrogenase
VKEASVVNVKGLIRNEEELKLFAPMGCAFQTGAGTVINLAKATSEDSVVVMGLGGVGLAAIMVSHISGMP